MVIANTSPLLLTIIIPVHQEGKTIVPVLQGLKTAVNASHEVFIVYDDPQDITLPFIQETQKEFPAVQALRNEQKNGIYGALQTGLKKARGQNVLFLVADDPGAILLISPMLERMQKGADLVSASRYVPGGQSHGGHVLSRCFSQSGNRLFQFLTGSPLSDATNGIKMFRRDILEEIDFQAKKDWTIAFELAIKAQYNDYKIMEIPWASFNRMSGGKSHFKTWPRLLAYTIIFCWGVGKLWGKNLRHIYKPLSSAWSQQ